MVKRTCFYNSLNRYSYWLVLFTMIQTALYSQNQTEIYGYPYFHQYNVDDYQAHEQNWDVVQDDRGLMYFANGNGLLIYNGSTWDLLEMPGQTMVQSLDRDFKGCIYLGASGHFGRIVYDGQGRPGYENLADSIPDSISITRVFTTICLDSAVYFQTAENVFRYKPGESIKVWEKGRRALGALFKINGELFLKEHYKGISKLVNDQWVIIPESEKFGPVFVHFMIPLDDDRILLDGGDSLWIFDGVKFQYFPTQADDYLKEHRIYCALSLKEQGFLVGTVNAGLIHIDLKGAIIMTLGESAGLNSLNIRKFYKDANDDIWVAMDAGLLLLQYPAPEKIFRFNAGNITINAFSRFNSRLYVASDGGLWMLNKEGTNEKSFSRVPGFNHKIWNIDSIGGQLIIATEFGVYGLQNNGFSSLLIKGVVPGFSISRFDPDRIYVFLQNGISLLSFENNSWSVKDILPEFRARTRGVIEMSPTEIWLDTDWTELWRIRFKDTGDFLSWSDPVLEKIDSNNSLPNERGGIYRLNERLYFVPRMFDTNFLWNESNQQFIPALLDPDLPGIDNRRAVIWDVDEEGNCFYVSDYGSGLEKMGLAIKRFNSYQPAGENFGKILNDIGESFLVEEKGIWLGGNSSIVLRDFSEKMDSFSFRTLIDRVISHEDSLIVASSWATIDPALKFRRNRLEFHFSATDFTSAGHLYFQTLLEGEDTDWSTFSTENSKQYFGLSPGKYTFRVRGINHENILSEEASFSFSILRPWYTSWWAYLLYGSSFLALLLSAARFRNSQLLREKERLEEIIEDHTRKLKERNQELLEKSELLATQKEKLAELDQLKTNLFANISHEFRTPLTLIKAPVDLLELEPEKVITIDEAEMIRRNADRLLRLVNQLLDLAKLDARSLQLELTEGDIFRFFRVEASSFSSLAAQKNIDFQLKIPSRQLWTSFDREKIETILYNLLNNAFKFTPSHGIINLTVEHSQENLHLEVSDNGPGIAPEHQELVFDRFYQIKEGNKPGPGGTGIGLSLCRELVLLMQGQIRVRSYPARGTSFYIDIPMVEIINPPGIWEGPVKPRMLERDPLQTRTHSASEEIVLVVEDHPEMRKYISSLLQDKYRIIEAVDGKDGLERAIREVPDLIITDTMMPSMDGHEFAQKIKNHECTSHIPIIMLTAKATLENKLTGLAAGVDSYLTKPFNSVELRSSIEALLVERKRLRKLFSRQLLVAPKEVAVHSLDQQFLEKVLTVLESHYSESTFGVPQMQKALAISKTQLHRKLTAITGQSSGEFLRNFRLQRAAQILAQKGESVTQVAFAVGFENVPYFTKCFKELFGIQPSRYKGNATPD